MEITKIFHFFIILFSVFIFLLLQLFKFIFLTHIFLVGHLLIRKLIEDKKL